jgi:hypothetical protein
LNSNPLPNHATGNNGVGMMEVESKDKVLKVSMKILYNMLVESGYLKRNDEHHLEKSDHCEFY